MVIVEQFSHQHSYVRLYICAEALKLYPVGCFHASILKVDLMVNIINFVSYFKISPSMTKVQRLSMPAYIPRHIPLVWSEPHKENCLLHPHFWPKLKTSSSYMLAEQFCVHNNTPKMAKVNAVYSLYLFNEKKMQ